MVAFLEKPTESEGFEQIVDFLSTHTLRYALTVNPTIYDSYIEWFWSTAMAKTINREAQIHAQVDGMEIIITELSVRRDLRLADEEGVDCLLNSSIFENLELMGCEGSTIPTNPQHTPTISKPSSSSQPQKTKKPRKPKRMNTKVPQPSSSTDIVADEAVYKKLDDSLVRAAATASSLEAVCQEAMRDTIAQTRFENVSKQSNDSLLARGNILQNDKDRMKLNELVKLCTNLQSGVLKLEKTKTTQGNEIDSLKRRVKKLEKKQRSRTHKLKRLYKVGLTARVDSSKDKQSLGEDASKEGGGFMILMLMKTSP
nr:xylulose kinase-1 [Tanacetum cinerariifolium]